MRLSGSFGYKGCSLVTLDTTEPLERATRFYEKHGYRLSGRVSEFFGMPLFEYVKVRPGPPASWLRATDRLSSARRG